MDSYISFMLNKMKAVGLTDEEYRNLQYNLIRNSEIFESNYPICETNFFGNSFILISDTHIGSGYENAIFMDYVYNYGVKNNISAFVHAGDLTEGVIRKRDKSLLEIQEEIVRAVNFISYYGLKNLLLLGNHDFSGINKHKFPELTDYFFNSSYVDILGLGKVVLNWNGVSIKLSHKISNKLINFENDVYTDMLSIEGHAHAYSVSEYNKTIKLPSLSNELKDSSYYLARDLPQTGIKLNLMCRPSPYIDFIKASFVEQDVILFEEFREKDGYLISPESLLYDAKSKTLKKVA